MTFLPARSVGVSAILGTYDKGLCIWAYLLHGACALVHDDEFANVSREGGGGRGRD